MIRSNLNQLDYKAIRKGILALSLRIIMIFLGYMFIYFLNNIYGTSFIGDFTLIQSIFFIISTICTLGFDTLSVKVVSPNRTNKKFLNIYYNRILFYILPLTIIVSIILYFFATNIALYFENINLSLPIRILSFSLLPLVLININGESFRGVKNMLFYSIYNKASLLSLLFILLFLIIDSDMQSIDIYYYLLYVIYFLALVSTIHWRFIYIGNLRNTSNHKSINEDQKDNLFNLSKNMLIVSIVFILFQYIDILMLGYLSTSEQVGTFTIMLKISSVVSIVLFGINSISGPIISNLFSDNKLDELRKYIKSIVRISSLLSIPIIILIIFFSDFILRLFDLRTMPYRNGLIIMCIAQLINVMSGSVGLIMQMTGHARTFKNIIIIALISNVILNLILIPSFQVLGAVYASSVSLILWNVLGAIYIQKKIKIYSFIQ